VGWGKVLRFALLTSLPYLEARGVTTRPDPIPHYIPPRLVLFPVGWGKVLRFALLTSLPYLEARGEMSRPDPIPHYIPPRLHLGDVYSGFLEDLGHRALFPDGHDMDAVAELLVDAHADLAGYDPYTRT